MKRIKLQIWHSDDKQEEYQHFLLDNITYIFGFNRKLLGNRAYEKVLKIVEDRLKVIPIKNRQVDIDKV